MFSLLNRFAWMICLILGMNIAYFFSDLFSGSYSSASENMIEGGWIFGILLSMIFKGVFLSESRIREGIDIPLSVDGSTSLEQTKFIGDTGSNLEEIPEINQKLDHNIEEPEKPESLNIIQGGEKSHVIIEKPNWLVEFFSDRPLAKIGGILLFLGAVFFLSLIWSSVGPVGKVLVGIIFGFSLYGLGIWMDTKGNIVESRTLLGVGIAVNALTILSGRWIIGSVDLALFSDTITLLFLVLNTLLAIITAILYSSRTFLVFSFAFAYIIPFLIQSDSDSTMMMLLYIAIVSCGGYLLSRYLLGSSEKEQDAGWLSYTVTLGSSILLSLLGFALSARWELIVFLIVTLILTAFPLFLQRRIKSPYYIRPTYVLMAGYVSLFSAIFGMGDTYHPSIILIYILAMIPLLAYTTMSIIVMGASLLFSVLLFIPLGFGLLLFAFFGFPSLLFVLFPLLFLYGIVGVFLLGTLSVFLRTIFFILLTIFLGIFSLSLSFQSLELSEFDRVLVSISVIVFFLLSLFSTSRYQLHSLSVFSLISSGLMLLLILPSGSLSSWMAFIIFVGIALFFSFFSERGSTSPHLPSLISYQVGVFLYSVAEIVYLGRDLWFSDSSNSLITLGAVILSVSIASVMYFTFYLSKIANIDFGDMTSLSGEIRTLISAFAGISLSLFSFSVALLFANTPLVVASIWIIEATILAYYTGRSPNRYIFVGVLALTFIGLVRILPYFESVKTGDYFALVPLFVIALALFLSAKYLAKENGNEQKVAYDILHVIGIGMIGYLMVDIVPSNRTGWSLLAFSLFILVSQWFYMGTKSQILSLWIVVLTSVYFLSHIDRIERLDLNYLGLFVQLSALAIVFFSAWKREQFDIFEKWNFTIVSVATLIVTSLYVHELTDTVFAVTIYLTIVSSAFIIRGIGIDRGVLRTVGLYIGTFVLAKILFYDIWVGVDNLIIRVLALMISGGVMITLSQLYGRSVSRSWSAEFSLDNFTTFPTSPTDSRESPKEEDIPFSENIAPKIKDIDISDTKTLKLVDPSGRVVYETRRMGILKLVKALILDLKKQEFTPGELKMIYNHIVPEIRSTLPKKDVEIILDTFSRWIDTGGSIQFK